MAEIESPRGTTAHSPDLGWSQVRETVLMLELSAAQIEAAMRESNGSVDVLTASFTNMAETLHAITETLNDVSATDDAATRERLLSAAGAGSITVEGRLTDGNNGAKIATFRDQMKDKMAVVNIDSYTWYGGSEANLEETAVNIASAINAPPGKIISQPSQIKLITY